jgi:hypothetical protein
MMSHLLDNNAKVMADHTSDKQYIETIRPLNQGKLFLFSISYNSF